MKGKLDWNFLVSIATALCVMNSGAALANCTGNTLWAYDATNHDIVTISVDGNATVNTVVSLDSSVPALEGIAWNHDGTVLFGVQANGTFKPINLTTGQLETCPTACVANDDLTPFPGEQVFSLTSFEGPPLSGFSPVATVVTNTNTGEVDLRRTQNVVPGAAIVDTGNPITGAASLFISGLDATSCNNDHYLGVTDGDVGLIRLFSWSESSSNPGNWSVSQAVPLSYPGNSVSSAAFYSGHVWSVGNQSNQLVRWQPTYQMFDPSPTPDHMGYLPLGTVVKGLSFGPAPGGSTTTSSTTSTTTTTTLAVIQQTPGQIDCIYGINSKAAKVSSAAAKGVEKCMKDAHKGKLAGTATPTMDDCVPADRKGRVAKAGDKTVAEDVKRCQAPNVPDYGYVGGAPAAGVHEAETAYLAAALFGPVTHTAVNAAASNKAAAKCQSDLLKAANKTLATKLKEFNSCKKRDLASGAILSGPALGGCLADLHDLNTKAGQKVAKAIGRIDRAANGSCSAVSSSTYLPGDCAGLSGATLSACVDALVECRACVMLTVTDDILFDCDLFDNGAIDLSCGF